MKLTNFKPLTSAELDQVSGGWAWVAVALPLIFGSIHQLISAMHAWNSPVGSFKDGKQEIKWDKRDTSKPTTQTYRVVYYAY